MMAIDHIPQPQLALHGPMHIDHVKCHLFICSDVIACYPLFLRVAFPKGVW